jgi:hypothetical protein
MVARSAEIPLELTMDLPVDFLKKQIYKKLLLSGGFRNKSLGNAPGLFYTGKYKFLVVVVDMRKIKNENYLIQTQSLNGVFYHLQICTC